MIGNLVSKYPRSGFLPGALMGGAGLIGAGLVSATGAGKYVAGAAAIGAGAKKGADWLGSRGSGGSESTEPNVSEELSKVSSIGLLSVEKLDAIYNNVVDIRKIMGGQDPESQARENALDEKVKKEELIKAIRGMGKGGGGGMSAGVKGGLLGMLKDLLGIGAIAALFANADKISEWIDQMPVWADKIDDAIDNIMEFVRDLDGFFESIGIEFGGAAMMGIGAGMRRGRKIAGRNPAARAAQVKAAKEAKAAKAKAKADRLAKRASDRVKARAIRAEAAKARSVAKAATKAEAKRLRADRAKARVIRAEAAKARAAAKTATKVEAKRLRAERNAARRQKISNQASRIKARITASVVGRGGGNYLERPGARAAAMAKVTPRGKGKFVEKLGERASYLRNKVQGLRYGAMGGNTGAGYNKPPKIPLKTPNILDEPSTLRDTAPRRSGPMNRGAVARGLTTLTPAPFRDPSTLRDTAPRRSGPMNRGGVARGLAALTPKMFRPDTVKPPTGQGGGYKVTVRGDGGAARRNYDEYRNRSTNRGVLSKVVGGVGTKIAQSGLVKDASTIVKSFRRSGGKPPIQPKVRIPPRLALALRVLPKWAVDLVMKAMSETGKAVGKTLLRIAGPLLLAYEIFELGKVWQDAPGDKDPFGDEPADIAFKQGMLRLGSTYGGAYFGAIGAGMLAGMFTVNPFVAFGAGLVGGVAGAIAGDKLMERWLMTDEQRKDATLQKKKAKLARIALDIETMKSVNVNTDGYERQYKNLSEEISVLEAAGSLDDNANVLIINQVDQSSRGVSARFSGTSVLIDDSSSNVVPYDGDGQRKGISGGRF